MIGYLKKYISKQTINDFQNAEMLINLFFSFVDFLFIAFSIILFYSEFRNFYSMTYQLIGIFFADIILRLYALYTLKNKDTDIFYKEIISCLISSDLFFLILSLFLEILKEISFKKDINISYPCLLYILISFSYENIISYSPLTFDGYSLSFSSFILLAQFIFGIIFAYYLYNFLTTGFGDIISFILKDKYDIRRNNKFIIGFPISCLCIYIFYYLIKLVILFCRDPLIILYGSLICNIIKEWARYFVFALCEIIVYLLNKIIKNEIKKRVDFEEIQVINS